MEKRKIAVFDFDGTLTTKDTLTEFIIFTHGKFSCYMGLLVFLPLILLMKLHILPNYKVKQWLFAWFYKGMKHSEFKAYGERFTDKIEPIVRTAVRNELARFAEAGADIYVVSASIDEWVRPFCMRLGVKEVLATRIEVGANGLLTGRFLTPNCYGQEKVNRLLAVEPNRESYCLYAYGDSRGDREMLVYADRGTKVKKQEDYV